MGRVLRVAFASVIVAALGCEHVGADEELLVEGLAVHVPTGFTRLGAVVEYVGKGRAIHKFPLPVAGGDITFRKYQRDTPFSSEALWVIRAKGGARSVNEEDLLRTVCAHFAKEGGMRLRQSRCEFVTLPSTARGVEVHLTAIPGRTLYHEQQRAFFLPRRDDAVLVLLEWGGAGVALVPLVDATWTRLLQSLRNERPQPTRVPSTALATGDAERSAPAGAPRGSAGIPLWFLLLLGVGTLAVLYVVFRRRPRKRRSPARRLRVLGGRGPPPTRTI